MPRRVGSYAVETKDDLGMRKHRLRYFHGHTLVKYILICCDSSVGFASGSHYLWLSGSHFRSLPLEKAVVSRFISFYLPVLWLRMHKLPFDVALDSSKIVQCWWTPFLKFRNSLCCVSYKDRNAVLPYFNFFKTEVGNKSKTDIWPVL